jgi:hypothetical protein
MSFVPPTADEGLLVRITVRDGFAKVEGIWRVGLYLCRSSQLEVDGFMAFQNRSPERRGNEPSDARLRYYTMSRTASGTVDAHKASAEDCSSVSMIKGQARVGDSTCTSFDRPDSENHQMPSSS